MLYFKRLFALLAVATLSAVFLSADMTMRQATSGKAMGFDGQGESVTYIQGMKMRTETAIKGNQTITILDLDAQQMIKLEPKKQRAEITDLAEMAEKLQEITKGDLSVTMKPTGRSQEIAGEPCDEYQMSIRVAASPIPDQPIQILMQGPVCLAPNSPGKEDIVRFYTAAAERGLFFGDPRVAKAQPGQAKGMVELYRAMAEKGVPYSTDLQVSFEGSGMIAALMAKAGKSSFKGLVTAVSAESLDPALFQIPAGYKIKKN